MAQDARKRRVARRSEDELEKLKVAGQIVGETLDLLRTQIAPGVTTLELDKLAEDHIRARGAVPSFKGYRGYPAATCIQVDDVVVHGIPDETVLKAGQVVGVDLGAYCDDYHGDAAFTTVVGQTGEHHELLDTTQGALMAGLAQARAGNRLKQISQAVQEYVESRGYNVVRQLVGHGVGQEMHEPPQIPNFYSRGEFEDYELVLQSGMVLAIEPMVNAGTAQVQVDEDGWTVRTADGELSAHFEHTVVVTEAEPLVLTLAEGAKLLSDVPEYRQA